MVITLDSESSDPSSNLGGTFEFWTFLPKFLTITILTINTNYIFDILLTYSLKLEFTRLFRLFSFIELANYILQYMWVYI